MFFNSNSNPILPLYIISQPTPANYIQFNDFTTQIEKWTQIIIIAFLHRRSIRGSRYPAYPAHRYYEGPDTSCI